MNNFLEMYKIATVLAIDAHGTQTYGKGPNCPPYFFAHITRIQAVLARFGINPNHSDPALAQNYKLIVIASCLHDAIEDTALTYEEIKSLLGVEVADLVAMVTDRPGKNRKEKHIITYPIIRQCENGRLLKLADRICNFEGAFSEHNAGMFSMYKKEMREFENLLRDDPAQESDVERAMWLELNAYALRMSC
jgi:(p)ppGpp synthase/HD superfamily hydrolase